MGFTRDSSVLEPLQGFTRSAGTSGIAGPSGLADPDILELVDSYDKESIAFQLSHSDRLYDRYFKHMNAGRLKVSSLTFPAPCRVSLKGQLQQARKERRYLLTTELFLANEIWPSVRALTHSC